MYKGSSRSTLVRPEYFRAATFVARRGASQVSLQRPYEKDNTNVYAASPNVEVAALKFHSSHLARTTTLERQTLPRTSGRFYNFFQECKQKGRPDLAYSLASTLVGSRSRAGTPSTLIWWCALKHYIYLEDSEAFLKAFRMMLSSEYPMLPGIPGNREIWRHALELGLSDINLQQALYEQLRRWAFTGQISRGDTYREFMSLVIKSFSHGCHDVGIIYFYSVLLDDSLGPPIREKDVVLRTICALPKAKSILKGLYVRLRSRARRTNFHNTVISQLCRLARFHDAQVLHHFLLRRGERPNATESIEHLLAYHVTQEAAARCWEFIHGLRKHRIALSAKAQNIVVSFFGSVDQLESMHGFAHWARPSSPPMDIDRLWSLAIQYHSHNGHDSGQIIRTLLTNKVAVGPETIHACIAAAEKKKTHKQKWQRIPNDLIGSLIRMIMSQSSRISPRASSVLVRYLAQKGDFRRAYDTLQNFTVSATEQITTEDTNYLRRCFILGLLEGKHFDELESRHNAMCIDGSATADTWNLLLRARIVDQRVNDARKGLEKMKELGFAVENATAQQFMLAILRPRKPGGGPEVLFQGDRRPYLEDVDDATKVLQKCLKLGGKTQPETWREIAKRLGLDGQFENLERLTDWLIPQYSTSSTLDPSKRYFSCHKALQRLAPGHPDHPLSRLLPPRDIGATITRGSRTGKITQALALVIKWQQMGVVVDRKLVQERIEIAMRSLAKQKGPDDESVEILKRQLMADSEQLK